MTTKVYKPNASGGELQMKSGSSWIPIYGISGFTASGGDRETSEFETLDGGIESSFGAAGVKDIAVALNPSFFNAQHRKIIENSYYGNDPVTIRYRTLAAVEDVAKGAAGHGISVAAISKGVGNEVDISFEGSDGASKVAKDAIEELAELGILLTGSDTAVGDSDRTEEKPADGKFLIARYDGDKYKASSWNGSAVSMLATKDGWVLMRHGIAYEYTCQVVSGGNPDLQPGQAIGDTLSLRQTSSGINIYPITKAAS